MIHGKSLGIPVVHSSLSHDSGECLKSIVIAYKISHFSPSSGKPLVKTSRMTVINTKEPAITVDIGGTIKTVRGVNVTINCQVAGEKFIYVLIHLFNS